MQRDLAGRQIVVTGVTRGVGRALAGQLLAAHAKVVGVARDPVALDALAKTFGPGFTPVLADLALDVAPLLAELPDQIDGLINNAGVQYERNYFEEDADTDADEIAINLTAPIALCAGLLPRLRQSPAPFIVNITSGLAFAPKEAAPVYCATKAGLQRFTTALRYQAETACPPMLVAEAILPLVDTGMTAGRGRGKISPMQAAEELIAGIRKGKEHVMIGKSRLLPPLLRLSPALVARMLR